MRATTSLVARMRTGAVARVIASAIACTIACALPAAVSAQTPAPDSAPASTATPTLAKIPSGTKIGSVPDLSPYRDLQTPQRITVFGGYYVSSKDVARATPGNGAVVGAQYEVTVGGPAQFFVRAARVGSTRTAYNPSASGADRNLGSVASALYLADLGFSFDLTGRKTWHSLVPIAGFGIGVASAGGDVSNDPYKFGTQFQLSTLFGVRYIPNNGLEARFTLGNAFYQTRYPTEYFVKANDGLSVVPQTEAKSAFRGNWMFTGGLSFPIFR